MLVASQAALVSSRTCARGRNVYAPASGSATSFRFLLPTQVASVHVCRPGEQMSSVWHLLQVTSNTDQKSGQVSSLMIEVRMNGVFLKEGETVERVDTDTGQKALDQLEDERAFEAAEIERSITAPDSNRKIIEEDAKHAYEHEAETGRFPKILICAVNDVPHTSHADQLVRIARD